MSLSPEILALDFAALRTLKLVHKHRSFAIAASELGMNPSSISYTIERVRKAAKDPLFFKQGGGVVPTDHCDSLIKRVEAILGEAERFRDDEEFNPCRAIGEITVNVSSYETMLVLPHVVRRLRSEAPGIRLVLNYNFGSAKDILLSGRADIYLGPQRINTNGIYGEEFLNREQHLCMMDPSNPLAGKSIIDLADIRDADFIYFEPRPGWQQAPVRYAKEQGINLNRAVVSSDAISFGDLLVGTDLLAALPSRMAQRFADRLSLKPFAFDTSMAEHMYWTASSDRSKLATWVRSVIKEEARIGQ